MAETVAASPAERKHSNAQRDMSRLVSVLRRQWAACGVGPHEEILVVGGGPEDRDMLSACGFDNIVMSNIQDPSLALDAENLTLPDER